MTDKHVAPVDHGAKIVETLEKLFHELGKTLSKINLSVSLEELHERYGEAIDMIILREEEQKFCEFLSGEFKISVVDAENYSCGYSLYFRDVDESFHALEAHSKPLEIKFLTEAFQKDLRAQNVLKFEIEEPSLNSRAKYLKLVKETKAAASEPPENVSV